MVHAYTTYFFNFEYSLRKVVMKTNTMKCIVATAIFLLTAQASHSGEFSVTCSYTNDNIGKCASVLTDLVTDKFIAKFPSTKYEIFVHSNMLSFSDGGFASYAVAGVVLRNSGQFPLNRFSSTKINGTDKNFNAVDLANYELQVYRSAVKSLMDQCEISPDCNVYIPRKQK